VKSMWSAAIVLCGALLLAGCGQKGPLYMPEQATQIITRPTQTPSDQKPTEPPADTPPAAAPEHSDAPSTPQTVDQPLGPDNPAPEVTAPDKNKKEPGAPAPR